MCEGESGRERRKRTGSARECYYEWHKLRKRRIQKSGFFACDVGFWSRPGGGLGGVLVRGELSRNRVKRRCSKRQGLYE